MPAELRDGGCSFPRRPDTELELLRQLEAERGGWMIEADK